MDRVRAIALMLGWLVGWRVCAPVNAAEWSQPHFQRVPGTEQLGNGIVTALAQDTTGLIWIGTTEGLLRFDGYRLRRFSHSVGDTEGLADNYVRALLAMPDGTLWIATQHGGIAVHDPQTDGFSHFRHDPEDAHSLAEDGAVALALGEAGEVWVGHANRGLDRFDPRSGRFEHFPPGGSPGDGPDHPTVRALLVDRDGDLWLGTGNGLQRRRAQDGVFDDPLSGHPDGFNRQYVYALYQAGDGAVWVGTQAHGAARLVREGPGWTPLRLDLGDASAELAWVDGFVEPSEGVLWMATFGGGLVALSTDGRTVLQRIRNDPAIEGSLALDRMIAPLRDRSGLVWIGTWGAGVQWHNPLNARAVRQLRHARDRPGGLSVPQVLSALELGDGRLWLGTGGNGIDVVDPDQGVIGGYRPDAARTGHLGDGTVRAMTRTLDGTRWVGTQQTGLYRFDAERGQFDPRNAGLPDQRIRLLAARADGRLAVGTQRGLAHVDPSGSEAVGVPRADGEAWNDPVWSLLEDRRGRLWVGRPGGLLRLTEQGLVDAGIAAPVDVLDLREDDEGGIWALTLDGLFHLARDAPDDAAWRPLALDLDVGEAGAGLGRQLLIDAQGYLWTPRYRIDPISGIAQRLEQADGFHVGNVDMGGARRLADGQLLFAGTRGLLWIDPAGFRPWTFEPPLVITALEVDGRPRPLSRLQRFALHPEDRRFSVEFAALDYSAPWRNRYAYRLIGLDTDWLPLEPGARRASYNRPWPGHYRLELRGSNRDGQWVNTPLYVDVEVMPHLWQTPAFGAVLLVLATVLVLVLLRWRTSAALQRTAQLQSLVDERTRALSDARDRAEASLLALQEAQGRLVEAEKLAALGQLVAGVAHEINTPVGVALTAASHLRERATQAADALQSGRITRRQLQSLHDDLHEACALILGSLERTGHLVASFKRVAVDRSEETSSAFRLGELAAEAEAALRPTCQRAGHALRVECSEDAEMFGYPGTVFQIIASLVGNALTHAFTAPGEVRVRLDRVADQVELQVEDNGCGMESEIATRAFDPFFTTRRGAGASGLGLHIVHNLVTGVLGGTIRLDSAPGQGSRFRIRFPFRTAAPP